MSTPTEIATTILATALHLKPAEIHEKTALGMSPQWDSLAHMRLILGLEERLGRQLDPSAILDISTLADVVKVVEES